MAAARSGRKGFSVSVKILLFLLVASIVLFVLLYLQRDLIDMIVEPIESLVEQAVGKFGGESSSGG